MVPGKVFGIDQISTYSAAAVTAAHSIRHGVVFELTVQYAFQVSLPLTPPGRLHELCRRPGDVDARSAAVTTLLTLSKARWAQSLMPHACTGSIFGDIEHFIT